MTRERDIEGYLRAEVRRLGGLALKWVSPGTPGVPDRLIFLPGRLILCEVKATAGRVTPLQARMHERLAALGYEVAVVSSREGVRRLLSPP